MKTIIPCFFLLLHLSFSSFAQVLTGVSPTTSNISETITLSVTGNNCTFSQGSFPPNLWLESPSSFEQIFPDNIQIVNDNQMLCTFTFTVQNSTGIYNIITWDPSGGYIELNNAFTLNPPLVPFQITGVSPNTASSSQVVNLNISTQGGSFIQNFLYTSVSLYRQGITLDANQLTPINNNQLTAQFIIPNNTPLGQYNVWIDNYIDGTTILNNAFTITPNSNPPALLQVNPNSGTQGSSLSVNISGQNTHFGQGTSTQVWFSQGSSTLIVPNAVNINSDTQLTASLQITSSNPAGFYNLHVTNAVDGYLTLANAFQVVFNPNAPQLVSVNPNTGIAGQSIPVTLSGQNTSFTQGTATLTFTQGSSTLNTFNLNITNDTQIEAMLEIPSWAPSGMYQANLQHSSLGNLSLQNAFQVTQPCNLSASVVQQSCGTSPAIIYISGSNPPPYQVVISGVSYTSMFSSFYFDLPAQVPFYLQAVYDQSGCSGSIGNAVISPSQSTATFTSATQACEGDEIMFSINTVASSLFFIQYGDGLSGTNTQHIYGAPGVYIPVAIFNSNGCYFSVPGDTIVVKDAPELQVTQVPASCGLNNGEINLSANGIGPFLYALNYPQLPLGAQTQYSNLAPGSYQVLVQGGNQCSTTALVTLTEQTNVQNINGIISDHFGNGIPGAKVLLFQLGNSVPLDTAICDANGSYQFNDLLTGQYMLAVAPDVASGRYMMYYPGSPVWQMADTIEVNCAGTQSLNISTTTVPNLSGFCSTQSTLSANGFSADSMYNNTEILIYHPGNMQVADFNVSSYGQCFISNLPDSLASAGYVVVPEIPFYSFIGASYLWCNGNQFFNIDANNKTISDMMLVGQKENKANTQAIVYPNPFDYMLTIEGSNLPSSGITVTILNSMGQQVFSSPVFGNSAGFRKQIETGFLPSGMYVLRLSVGKEVYRYKLIKS